MPKTKGKKSLKCDNHFTSDFSPKLRDKIRNVKPGFEARGSMPGHCHYVYNYAGATYKYFGLILHAYGNATAFMNLTAQLQVPYQAADGLLVTECHLGILYWIKADDMLIELNWVSTL